MPISPLKKLLGIALLAGMTATTAFAEDAPVYDVDSYPPQFDGSDPSHGAAKPSGAGDTSAFPSAAANPSAMPADADTTPQTFGPPPRSLTLDQRVQRLEQQTSNVLNSDSSTKLGDIQTEVQTLRGQVEELNHQIQQLQAQQKSMYSDLDKRLGNRGGAAAATNNPDTDSDLADAGTTPTPATDATVTKPKKAKKVVTGVVADAAATTPAPTGDDATADAAGATDSKPATDTTAADAAKTDGQPNVAEEQQIYQTAYNLIKAKKYSDAATTLQKMLRKYPSGQFAANAHYWLGELYGLMAKNDQAIAEFNNVVKNYPDSPKLANAQLKLGMLFAAQMKWSDAKSSFKKVINHYPGTSSAHLAADQLKQIKLAGH